jgi:hypothetical protein
MYEGRLKSSWTHLITLSWNFVEVQWWSLFWSTSLGKWCTSWKRSADRWSLQISCPSPFSWLEKPRNHMGWDVDCMADVLMGFHQSTFSKLSIEFNSDLTPCNFWAFPTMKKELQGKKFWIDQQSVKKWVESCKKCIACQGGTSKRRPSLHLHKVLTRSNKVSPQTLQVALVICSQTLENDLWL